MMALLSLLPIVGNFFSGLAGKYFDAKVSIYQSKTGLQREEAVQAVRAQIAAGEERVSALKIISSNVVLTMVIVLAAIPILGFEWKVVIWDTMLGLGSTPAIHGQVADWMNTIIYFLFGSPTAIAVTKMWYDRNRS
jgi:hypothetical protein